MNDGKVQMDESQFGIKAERPETSLRSAYSRKSEGEKEENQIKGSGFKYYYSGRKLL
jgi:hypothetical protein